LPALSRRVGRFASGSTRPPQ